MLKCNISKYTKSQIPHFLLGRANVIYITNLLVLGRLACLPNLMCAPETICQANAQWHVTVCLGLH